MDRDDPLGLKVVCEGDEKQTTETSSPPAGAGDNALDAFGKGRGKGKGEPRGPLQCYSCLGEGHPQFLCASGKGVGKANQGPVRARATARRFAQAKAEANTSPTAAKAAAKALEAAAARAAAPRAKVLTVRKKAKARA